MNWLKRTLGYDPSMLWFYRDLALGTISGIATLWAVVLLLVAQHSQFDLRVAAICIGLAVLCCAVSPNRLLILGSTLGIVAVQGWYGVAFSRDIKVWWVAGSATLALLVWWRLFAKRPARRQ